MRIAAMIGGVVAGLLVLTWLVGSGDPSAVPTLAGRIGGGVAISALVIAAVLLVTRGIEGRPPRDIGLRGGIGGWPAFLGGVALWLVPAALAFAILAALGHPLTVSAPPGRFWVVSALLFLAVLVSEAVPEEIVFRGYVSAVLAERLRGWWVILAQTAFFTLTVLVLRGGLAPLDLSLFIAMGVVLGYLRMITDSVWTAVGFHAAFQTGSQLVLTHDVVEFSGPMPLALLALGAVPFTAAIVGMSVGGAVRPRSSASARR